MAAAVAEAAPFRPQAAAPRLLPIRRGHGNPATASVPRGPLPRPRHRRDRPPSRPSPLLGLAQEVSALCPQPEALSVAAGPAPPRFLPSFVTRARAAAAAAAAAAAVVVAEERKGEGPEGYTRSHFQVPPEGEEVGLQKRGGQEQFHPSRPVSPSSSCSLHPGSARVEGSGGSTRQ